MRTVRNLGWCAPLLAFLIAWSWAPVRAQDYGTGVVANVPYVEAGEITIDGVADEAAWEDALLIDPTVNWDGGWSGHPDADVTQEVRLLYTENWLYIHTTVLDYALWWAGGGGDHLLVGIDPLHEAGVSDQLTDPNWGGWPDNAPDAGPYAYKIWAGNDTVPAFSLNFSEDLSPVDSGWVDGVFFQDESTGEWGFEAAIYVPTATVGSQIGFNIGGGQGKEEGMEDRGEGTYAFYAWQVCAEPGEGRTCQYAGGNVMSDAGSFATLNLVDPNAPTAYGTGVVETVPSVDPAAITIDGVADEAAWDDALMIDPTVNWDGGWSGHPDADVLQEARVLYADDWLYVYTIVSDYALWWSGGGGDHLLVGIDPIHEAGVTDQMTDPNWGGWPDNAPDAGPYAYKIWAGSDTIPAFSLNFSEDLSPEDSGWVDGAFFLDENTNEWGFEAAFYVPGLAEGTEIGFNIGGGQGKEEGIEDRGEGTYAFYAWQVCENPADGRTCQYAGGNVMSDAGSFATLAMGQSTAIERSDEVPGAFALEQNYPNPFNPTTTIEFGLQRAAHVNVSVFNTLGQRIATLADGAQQAGTYRVTWDATAAPSGVYLYQMRVDGQVVEARKMVLMR